MEPGSWHCLQKMDAFQLKGGLSLWIHTRVTTSHLFYRMMKLGDTNADYFERIKMQKKLFGKGKQAILYSFIPRMI